MQIQVNHFDKESGRIKVLYTYSNGNNYVSLLRNHNLLTSVVTFQLNVMTMKLLTFKVDKRG